MDEIVPALILFLLVGAWVYLPFRPALRELIDKRDVAPVRVSQRSDVDVHHFAEGYRSFLHEHLSEPLERCRAHGQSEEGRLDDGTPYVVFGSDDSERSLSPTADTEAYSTMVLSCGDLELAPRTSYLTELFAEGSVTAGENVACRAVLADKGIRLGPQSVSLRWMHAGERLSAATDCRLYGRVSSDTSIELREGCHFERLNAPRITFGDGAESKPHRVELESLDSDDLPNVVDVKGGRWLIRKRLELPASRQVEADLVVTGRARIGEGARIVGSIKARKDLHLCRGVEVLGSVVSGRDLVIEQGCRIHGPVLAERSASIGSETVLGSPDHPTTLSARKLHIAPDVTTHGTVWAHREGAVGTAAGDF